MKIRTTCLSLFLAAAMLVQSAPLALAVQEVPEGTAALEEQEELLPEQAEARSGPGLNWRPEGASYQLYYQEETDGTVTITGWTGTASGPLVLPAELNKKPVARIGNAAFYGQSGFTGELVIPEGVKTVDEGAFYGCTGLTGTLTLPASLTEIKGNAFRKSGLTGTVTLPSGLSLLEVGAFAECPNLTALEITGSTAWRSQDGILYSADGKTLVQCPAGYTGALTIPAEVTAIDHNAFHGCTGLTGPLTLPQGLQTIGGSAFYGCTGLTGDLSVPAGVSTIRGSAFEGCTGLTGTLTFQGTALADIADDASANC